MRTQRRLFVLLAFSVFFFCAVVIKIVQQIYMMIKWETSMASFLRLFFISVLEIFFIHCIHGEKDCVVMIFLIELKENGMIGIKIYLEGVFINYVTLA